MSIILKGSASWYSATDKGGNANVAMMSARRCPDCVGSGDGSEPNYEGGYKVFGKCKRCHGDGKLINQMPFNPMGLEAAMPLSLIEKHGLKFGQLLKVMYKYNTPTIYPEDQGRPFTPISFTFEREVIVRLVDIGPNEKLCAECRIIDLTEFAFRQLEDPSKGIIEIELGIL
jgi:hypothetical protein